MRCYPGFAVCLFVTISFNFIFKVKTMEKKTKSIEYDRQSGFHRASKVSHEVLYAIISAKIWTRREDALFCTFSLILIRIYRFSFENFH